MPIILCKGCQRTKSVLTLNHKYCNACRLKNRHIPKYKPGPIIENTCKQCNRIFETTKKNKLYCTPECQLEQHQIIRQGKRIKGVEEKRTCLYCNKTFKSAHNKKQYCSENCYIDAKKIRDHAYYMKQKENKNEIS